MKGNTSKRKIIRKDDKYAMIVKGYAAKVAIDLQNNEYEVKNLNRHFTEVKKMPYESCTEIDLKNSLFSTNAISVKVWSNTLVKLQATYHNTSSSTIETLLNPTVSTDVNLNSVDGQVH